MFRSRGPRLRVLKPSWDVREDPPRALVRLEDVLDDGEKVQVTGIGATVNEAARNAFRHAADLMFPPSSE